MCTRPSTTQATGSGSAAEAAGRPATPQADRFRAVEQGARQVVEQVRGSRRRLGAELGSRHVVQVRDVEIAVVDRMGPSLHAIGGEPSAGGDRLGNCRRG